MTSTTIQTEKSPIYLVQLCKHFGHKIQVEQQDGSARFCFESGVGYVQAQDSKLTLVAEARTKDDREKIQNILGAHLERFAFRENITVIWPEGDKSENQEEIS